MFVWILIRYKYRCAVRSKDYSYVKHLPRQWKSSWPFLVVCCGTESTRVTTTALLGLHWAILVTNGAFKESSAFLREDSAFFPEGVEALVTGLGSLCGDGQQVRGAATFNTAWREKRAVRERKRGGADKKCMVVTCKMTWRRVTITLGGWMRG